MAFRDVLRRISKVKSTILNDIWVEIVFFTLVAAVVTMVTTFTSRDLSFNNQLMTVLGTALGFVISFRTSTAYERFAEGRQLWTTIAITSRTLAQTIWIQIPFRRVDKTGSQSPGTEKLVPEVEVVVEKKSMVNLVQAYSVAVKHMLRGEGGVYYKDLYPLIALLPRFSLHEDKATEEDILPLWQSSKMDYSMFKTIRSESFPTIAPVSRSYTDPSLEKKEHYSSDDSRETHSLPDTYGAFDVESQLLPRIPCEQQLLPAKNTPPGFFRHYVVPFFRWLRNPFRRLRQHRDKNMESTRNFLGKKRQRPTADGNVAMEIAMFLLSYHGWLVEHKYIPDSAASNMYSGISALQNAVVHLERIKNTPLPFAYQAHLRISLWMYLFFLPSQLYTAFGLKLTIPATAISAFILLGFLEIGQEIENPFDYDDSDLDLDAFCYAIQRELHEVTAHISPDPRSCVFSKWNMPFAPEDHRTADQIVSDATHPYHHQEHGRHSMRKTMLRCWKQVDVVTRSTM